MTMTLIETKVLGTAAASIEFTSIPQDGTDLVAFISVRNTGTSDRVTGIRFNGDTGSNYSSRLLYGTGSSAASFAETTTRIYGGDHPGSAETANTFGSSSLYIPNYTGSTTKSASIDVVYENNATAAWQQISAHLWNNTSAITTLLVYAQGGTFVAGSTVSLYKITKGSSGGVVVS